MEQYGPGRSLDKSRILMFCRGSIGSPPEVSVEIDKVIYDR